jgi:hypothetical protein
MFAPLREEFLRTSIEVGTLGMTMLVVMIVFVSVSMCVVILAGIILVMPVRLPTCDVLLVVLIWMGVKVLSSMIVVVLFALRVVVCAMIAGVRVLIVRNTARRLPIAILAAPTFLPIGAARDDSHQNRDNRHHKDAGEKTLSIIHDCPPPSG